jgi:hypothetical protein
MMELDVAHRFGPIGRRQSLDVPPAQFQVVNQIEKQIHRPMLLSRRSRLIDNGVNGDRGIDARYLVADLIGAKRLNDSDGAVLAIRGMAAPPQNAKDLAGVEVINTAPSMLLVLMGGRTKAKAIKTGMGNMAGNETS